MKDGRGADPPPALPHFSFPSGPHHHHVCIPPSAPPAWVGRQPSHLAGEEVDQLGPPQPQPLTTRQWLSPAPAGGRATVRPSLSARLSVSARPPPTHTHARKPLISHTRSSQHTFSSRRLPAHRHPVARPAAHARPAAPPAARRAFRRLSPAAPGGRRRGKGHWRGHMQQLARNRALAGGDGRGRIGARRGAAGGGGERRALSPPPLLTRPRITLSSPHSLPSPPSPPRARPPTRSTRPLPSRALPWSGL